MLIFNLHNSGSFAVTEHRVNHGLQVEHRMTNLYEAVLFCAVNSFTEVFLLNIILSIYILFYHLGTAAGEDDNETPVTYESTL